MEIVCLDLEGVLVPEIWIAFAEKTGLPQLKLTTRDEPDYKKLMRYRMAILDQHHLSLLDIQDVIATITPLPGAKDFLDQLRSLTQVVILSDTFTEFAQPLMRQLGWPTILCNSLKVDENNMIVDFIIRKNDGKKAAIDSFKALNFRTFASGDSYNDLSMIQHADGGCLFRAPAQIITEHPNTKICNTYPELLSEIKTFISNTTN